jgi:hypothetical protein
MIAGVLENSTAACPRVYVALMLAPAAGQDDRLDEETVRFVEESVMMVITVNLL